MKNAKSDIADFYEKERPGLIRFLRRRLSGAGDMDAEDVLQEVFVNLFNRADVSAPVENLAAYVYGCLRNRVADIARARKSALSLDEMEENGGAPPAITGENLRFDPVARFEERAFMEALQAALNALEPRQREVWVATELRRIPFQELSEKWGEPVGTLLSRKSRANRKLRETLNEYGIRF